MVFFFSVQIGKKVTPFDLVRWFCLNLCVAFLLQLIRRLARLKQGTHGTNIVFDRRPRYPGVGLRIRQRLWFWFFRRLGLQKQARNVALPLHACRGCLGAKILPHGNLHAVVIGDLAHRPVRRAAVAAPGHYGIHDWRRPVRSATVRHSRRLVHVQFS